MHTDTHTGATHYNLIAKQPWTGKISLNDKSRKIKKKEEKRLKNKIRLRRKGKRSERRLNHAAQSSVLHL